LCTVVYGCTKCRGIRRIPVISARAIVINSAFANECTEESEIPEGIERRRSNHEVSNLLSIYYLKMLNKNVYIIYAKMFFEMLITLDAVLIQKYYICTL